MKRLTPKQALEQGYTVDKTVYPWVGLKAVGANHFQQAFVWTDIEAQAMDAVFPASRALERLAGLVEEIRHGEIAEQLTALVAAYAKTYDTDGSTPPLPAGAPTGFDAVAVTIEGDGASQEPTTLAEFFAANEDYTETERIGIHALLLTTGRYVGGGGATAVFKLRLVQRRAA